MMLENEKNINWELAARVLSGEADEIDRGLLEQWVHADRANEQEWERIKDSWLRGEEALFVQQTDTESAWKNVHRFTKESSFPEVSKGRTFSLGKTLAVAASVIVVLGLSWFLLLKPQVNQSSLIVSNSPREEMLLSDGSKVILNNSSRFLCNQPFNDEERTVELEGEGFFEVEGDIDWPFVINTGDVTIRVTGTKFNVRAYPNMDVTEIAVLEGRVEVVPPSEQEMVVLTVGQTALFDKKSRLLSVVETTDPNLLSWLTGQIKFEETPLSEVVETLGRVYSADFQFSDEELGEQKLTARFSDNSLDFVLEVVCTTFNLESKREGETIFLSAQK
ncbi:FecR domain-containing protein [Marinilabilia salmonicolor]|jgi:ferric-dicitrate binding protein FerR (iron transport regulator)|nr:FecR domain-containing protein [Marinilabilia salmonicolor]